MLKFFTLFVQILIKARIRVPHKRIDAGFKRKVQPLVLKIQIFFIQNVAQGRHVQGADSHCTVKIDRIGNLIARRIEHGAGLCRNGIEPVFPFKIVFDPRHVFLQNGHYFFYAPFICRFMVQIVFRPRKQGQADPFGIFFCYDGRIVRRIVFPTYGAAVFPALIQVIEVLMGRKIAVRIHQKERRKNRFELIYNRALIFFLIYKISVVGLRSRVRIFPKILNP